MNDNASRPTARPHPLDASIHWIEPGKFLRYLLWGFALLLLLAPLGFGYLLGQILGDGWYDLLDSAAGILILVMVGLLIVTALPFLLMASRQTYNRIGVIREWVLVRRANGDTLIARDVDLLWLVNGFIIDGITIPLGNKRVTFYPKDEVKTWLEPRLARGTRLGPVAHLGWLWHHKRRDFILVGMLILALLALVAALESGWLEHVIDRWLESRPGKG